MTTSQDQRKLIFLDVDGVLLDYEAGFTPFVQSKGFSVPATYEDRDNYYYSAMPGVMTKEQEGELVQEFGTSGGLAELPGYSELDSQIMAFLLNNPQVFILSTFKESFRQDRYNGLAKAFGPFPATKILSSFSIKKGAIIKDVCERYGVPTSRALMVDDLGYNLASAAEVGAKTLLIEHGYNKNERSSYASVPKSGLIDALNAFLFQGDPNGSS